MLDKTKTGNIKQEKVSVYTSLLYYYFIYFTNLSNLLDNIYTDKECIIKCSFA